MKSILLSAVRITGITAAVSTLLMLIAGCGGRSPHNGRFPFSLADRAPSAPGGGAMTIVMDHHQSDGPPPVEKIASIKAGDVIAFHMSHAEAWSHLRQGKIQKIPYELFRYGHIAIVVPDPEKTRPTGDLRLLQIAMKQAANAGESLRYLDDKSWIIYRPPSPGVDVRKLHEFTRRVTVTACDPKKAYDYRGITGIRNAPCEPAALDEIGGKYSCATLVLAALHYSGLPLKALHRDGWFDIVTPRQIVESSSR